MFTSKIYRFIRPLVATYATKSACKPSYNSNIRKKLLEEIKPKYTCNADNFSTEYVCQSFRYSKYVQDSIRCSETRMHNTITSQYNNMFKLGIASAIGIMSIVTFLKNDIDKQFEKVDKQFEKVDKQFEKVERDINIIRGDIAEIKAYLINKQ